MDDARLAPNADQQLLDEEATATAPADVIPDVARELSKEVRAESRAPTHNLVGAFWMLGSALANSISGVLIKGLGDAYNPAFQNFTRQFVGLLVVTPIILRLGKRSVATSQPGLMLYRGAAIMVGATLSLYSMQILPLAQANALSFTRALWLVPMALLLLREKVSATRAIATVLGFGGVLIMIRPSAGGFTFSTPILAALGSAFLFASTGLSVRMAAGKTEGVVVFVWSALLGVVFAVPGAVMTWKTPTLHDGLVLLAIGLLASAGQACFIRGSAVGEASVMAPIDYTRLLFSAAGAYLAFGETPSNATWIGSAIVIVTTLAATWQPAKRAGAAA
jgi:drug/metabolite transporter (DMT)-like permease